MDPFSRGDFFLGVKQILRNTKNVAQCIFLLCPISYSHYHISSPVYGSLLIKVTFDSMYRAFPQPLKSFVPTRCKPVEI